MSSEAASNFHCCPFEEKAEPLSEDERLEIRQIERRVQGGCKEDPGF